MITGKLRAKISNMHTLESKLTDNWSSENESLVFDLWVTNHFGKRWKRERKKNSKVLCNMIIYTEKE